MAILMAMKRFSIAEAKNQLPELVRAAEGEGAVEITRRGEPVAVLVSKEEYERLRRRRSSFAQEAERFRRRHATSEDLSQALEGLRDPSPGR